MIDFVSDDLGLHEGAYVVPRPRVTDAIGGALLGSYAPVRLVPGDMQRLLDRLDRQPRGH